MQKLISFFMSKNIFVQILFVSTLATFVIFTFGFLYQSVDASFDLFMDPSSITDMDKTSSKLALGILEVIFAVSLMGLIGSLITSKILDSVEVNRLSKVHKTLKEAFETISSIRTRKLVKELSINSRVRMLNADEAEIRLELPKSDIVRAIQRFGKSRLRMMKNTNEIVIEEFESNKPYGYYKNSDSNTTVVSTQNYSDAGIGHFAATFANSIGANYISNEFYSSGAPLKSKQINFSNNDCYTKFSDKCKNNVMASFIKDIVRLCTNQKLIVYIATSNADRPNDIHILFGGDLGQIDFNIDNPSFSNLGKLKEAYEKLSTKLNEFEIRSATHEEFANNKDNHLSQAIHRNLGVDVVSIYVSTKILYSKDDMQYYNTMKCLIDFIEDLS